MTTDDLALAGPTTSAQRVLQKVPQATAWFWGLKVLTTGMGEAAADDLADRLGMALAAASTGLLLVTSLVLQFGVRRYVPWIYWLAVSMVGVFGTLAADTLYGVLGISFLTATLVLSAGLAVVFAVWFAAERTLSIHSIHTRRREAFYWTAVMATFMLGTAAGDMTAETFGLGFLASGVLFLVVIAVPAVAHLRFGMNGVLAFWLAYILTRPLGASFADWLGHARGGLGWGAGPVAVGMTLVIAALVAYLTRRDGVTTPALTS